MDNTDAKHFWSVSMFYFWGKFDPYFNVVIVYVKSQKHLLCMLNKLNYPPPPPPPPPFVDISTTGYPQHFVTLVHRPSWCGGSGARDPYRCRVHIHPTCPQPYRTLLTSRYSAVVDVIGRSNARSTPTELSRQPAREHYTWVGASGVTWQQRLRSQNSRLGPYLVYAVCTTGVTTRRWPDDQAMDKSTSWMSLSKRSV